MGRVQQGPGPGEVGHGHRAWQAGGGPGESWAPGQAGCLLLSPPRGLCDTPLPGVLHAKIVAQCGPREGHSCRHHTPLPPGTQKGSLQWGFGSTLTPSHTYSEMWRQKAYEGFIVPGALKSNGLWGKAWEHSEGSPHMVTRPTP